MEQVISQKKSILIIVATTIILIIIGNFIGYEFFWDQYDRSSSSQKKAVHLEEQVIVNPDDTENQLNLAWTYYHQEKYDQAKEQFDQIIKQDGKSFDANYGLANAYMGLKQYGEAEKLLLELEQVAPEDDLVLYDLGIVQREQERYADAEKTFKKALQINRASADMYFDLAVVYEKMKNNQKAIEHYQKSIDLVPNFAEALAGLRRLGVEKYEPKKYH